MSAFHADDWGSNPHSSIYNSHVLSLCACSSPGSVVHALQQIRRRDVFQGAVHGFHATDRELAVERVIRLMTAQNHLAERQGLPAARHPCLSRLPVAAPHAAHAGGDRGEECGAQGSCCSTALPQRSRSIGSMSSATPMTVWKRCTDECRGGSCRPAARNRMRGVGFEPTNSFENGP